jgi:hypothetical protein
MLPQQREGVNLLSPIEDPRSMYVLTYTAFLFSLHTGTTGPRILKNAGTFCWFSDVLLSYVTRLNKDPSSDLDSEYTNEYWATLLWRVIRYQHHGPKRRWGTFLTSPANLLSEPGPDADSTSGSNKTSADSYQIGCMNFQSCPQRIRLEELRNRQRQLNSETSGGDGSSSSARSCRAGCSSLTKEEVTFLIDFGANLSFCGG